MPSAAIPTVYRERTPYPRNARCVLSEGDETCTPRTALKQHSVDLGYREMLLVMSWFRHEDTKHRCALIPLMRLTSGRHVLGNNSGQISEETWPGELACNTGSSNCRGRRQSLMASTLYHWPILGMHAVSRRHSFAHNEH